MAEIQDVHEQQKISTFVFFDLETIGLQKGTQNKVTELSMVAVDRTALLESPTDKLPRVLNKLSIPIYPMKQVPYVVFDLTGLDNVNLQSQKDFDDDLGSIMSLFLHRLQPPVCLVAHNGINFDYPLLKRELLGINTRLPEDLLCIDSYRAFQIYDWDLLNSIGVRNEMTPTKSRQVGSGETPILKRKSTHDESGNGTGVKRFSVIKRELFPSESTQSSNGASNHNNRTHSRVTQNSSLVSESSDEQNGNSLGIHKTGNGFETVKGVPSNTKGSGDENSDWYWPDLEEITDTPWDDLPDCFDENSVPSSGAKLEKGASFKSEKSPYTPKGISQITGALGSNPEGVLPHFAIVPKNGPRYQTPNKQNLVTSSQISSGPSRSGYKPRSLKLPEIHRFVTGARPTTSHTSEDDCLSLLRIVQHTADWFLPWADGNAMKFDDILLPFTVPKSKNLKRGHFPNAVAH